MRKFLVIYEEAFSHIWLFNCSTLNFLIYKENFILFLSVQGAMLLIRSDRGVFPNVFPWTLYVSLGWYVPWTIWPRTKHPLLKGCPGKPKILRVQKPNSWTYSFVEVSGHNLESSQTLGFFIHFLNHREGGMDFYQVFLLSSVQCIVTEL